MPSATAPVTVVTDNGRTIRTQRYSNGRSTWLDEYRRELGCMNPACKHTCTYPFRPPPPIILLTLQRSKIRAGPCRKGHKIYGDLVCHCKKSQQKQVYSRAAEAAGAVQGMSLT